LFDSPARQLRHCRHDSHFCAKLRRVRTFSNESKVQDGLSDSETHHAAFRVR
jgi:hypothetical protein